MTRQALPTMHIVVGSPAIITARHSDYVAARGMVREVYPDGMVVFETWWGKWIEIGREHLIHQHDPLIGTLDDPVPYSWSASPGYNQHKPAAIDYDSRCACCYLGHSHTIQRHVSDLAGHAVGRERERIGAWIEEHKDVLLAGKPPACNCRDCRGPVYWD